MPGAINLPSPGVWRPAPAFNHHRKIGPLVQCEVHAPEYKSNPAGSRVNAILSNLSAHRCLSLAYNTDEEVRGRSGLGWPLFPVWVDGTPSALVAHIIPVRP